ncbi:MAG: sigma-70 family RNA polymerase sigma factor [Prolixibacteraceae bacterium]|nr:sigma-70 family RNA polymerase sigma factor [Prolixibacteraceae bacterium]
MKKINWDELYRKNAPLLVGVCRRYTSNEAVALDLVQDTFVTAMNKIEDYKGKGNIEGWIRRIAVNKALMYLRSLKTSEILSEKIVSNVQNETGMETPVHHVRYAIEKASFTTGELLAVIDALPTHHKTVFNLHVIDGYKHKQIAQLLGISPGTSKSHLARARKKAQELLYSRALEKGPEEKRKNSLVFLLLLLPNRIDSIFRKGFRSYELPVNPFPQMGNSSGNSIVKQGITLTGKLVISGIVASFFVAGFFIVRLDFSNEALPEKQELLTGIDTVLNIEKQVLLPAETVSAENVTTDAAGKNTVAPVIVKKQIVIHDTIRLERPAEN